MGQPAPSRDHTDTAPVLQRHAGTVVHDGGTAGVVVAAVVAATVVVAGAVVAATVVAAAVDVAATVEVGASVTEAWQKQYGQPLASVVKAISAPALHRQVGYVGHTGAGAAVVRTAVVVAAVVVRAAVVAAAVVGAAVAAVDAWQ